MRHTLRWSATPRTVFYPIAAHTVKLRFGCATPSPRIRPTNYSSTRRKITTALWPPKPMDSESATLIGLWRASLGT